MNRVSPYPIDWYTFYQFPAVVIPSHLHPLIGKTHPRMQVLTLSSQSQFAWRRLPDGIISACWPIQQRSQQGVRQARLVLPTCSSLWVGQGALVRFSEDDAKYAANDASE
jgi:hypothetical protein